MSKDYIYYNQGDPRWAKTLYSPHMTYAEGGCGPSSVAMAVSKINGNPEVTPVDVGDYIRSIGGVTDGQGTNWNAIPLAVQHFGFKCEQLTSYSEYGTTGLTKARKTFYDRVSTERYSGIDLFGPGYYTNGGHFTHAKNSSKSTERLWIEISDVAYPPRSGKRYSNDIANSSNAPGAAQLGKPFHDRTQKICYTIDYGDVPAIGGKTFKLPQVSMIQGSYFNDSVVVLQRYLVSYGFLKSTDVDGYFGPGTKAAVKNFQKSKGLTADGICGPKTWSKIINVPSGKNDGTRYIFTIDQLGFGKVPTEPDPYCKAVQRYLKGVYAKDSKTGLLVPLYSDKVDGWYGNDTTKAVLWFQSIFKLNKDGICGPNTLNKMFGG